MLAAQKAEADASWWPSFLPSSKVNLGLDLQGGVYLLMEIDPEEVASNRLTSVYADVTQELNNTGRGRIFRTPTRTPDRISLELRDPTQQDDAVRRIERYVDTTAGAAGTTKLLDVRAVGSNRVDIQISEAAKSIIAKDSVKKTIEIVRRRIDPDGKSDVPVLHLKAAYHTGGNDVVAADRILDAAERVQNHLFIDFRHILQTPLDRPIFP